MSKWDFGRTRARRTGRCERRRSLRYAFVIPAVFVSAVTTMAVKDGLSAAVTTGLLIVAGVGITVGLWGTAMAVRETDELASRRGDEFPKAVAVRNTPSAR